MKTKKVLGLVFVILAIYTFWRFGIDQLRPPGMIPGDYENFHRACVRLAQNIDVYQADDDSPYKYSPTFLFAFNSTFHAVERHDAWRIWCALSILGFLCSVWWLWSKTIDFEKISRPLLFSLIFAFGAFGWHGLIEHFSYGQGDMILFTIYVAAVAIAEHWQDLKGDLLSALCMGGLLIMKPQGGIFLAYFLLIRRFRLLGLVGISTVALLFLPALHLGLPQLFKMFGSWKICLQLQKPEFILGNLNQTLAASLARWMGLKESVKPLISFLVVLGGALCVFLTFSWKSLARSGPKARAQIAGFVVLLYAVVSPLSWRWFTFIWLPIGVLFSIEAIHARNKLVLSLLGSFAVIGILLQTHVAHFVGIREIDDLSFYGFYSLNNLLLFSSALFLLNSQEKKNSYPS